MRVLEHAQAQPPAQAQARELLEVTVLTKAQNLRCERGIDKAVESSEEIGWAGAGAIPDLSAGFGLDRQSSEQGFRQTHSSIATA